MRTIVKPQDRKLRSLSSFGADSLIIFHARGGRRVLLEEKRAPMPEHEFEQDELVITEEETRLKEPSLFNVLIHNDNFTTMEFVVYVLHNIFQQSETNAIHIMLQVHLQGVGVAGIYPFEIAEMKVAKVTSLAQANEFPLLCTIEQASE